MEDQNLIDFGKYHGKTYSYVLENDVAYCNWLLRQLNVNGKLKKYQDCLKTKAKKETCDCCNGTGLMNII